MAKFVSLKDKIRLSLELAEKEGTRLNSSHRAQVGLGTEDIDPDKITGPIVRKAEPPIPRKYSKEQAALIRAQYFQFKIGIRTLAKMHQSPCLGTVHHAIFKRGAYKDD